MKYENQTPVLFLIFNRPDATRLVLAEIVKARPPRLYIAGDGPRDSKGPKEVELVECLRQEVLSQITWDCQVKTLFRQHNLGCRQAVSQAIDWFFQNEEEGIILEDDCLPSPHFFRFCQELLQMFRENDRVMAITGFNDQAGRSRGGYGYYFSRIAPTWGWATWRQCWREFHRTVAEAERILRDSVNSGWTHRRLYDDYWRDVFMATLKGEIDSWGYLWAMTVLASHGLVAVANCNLIVNVGFGTTEATHTRGNSPSHYSRLSATVDFPLVENPEQAFDHDADDFTYLHSFQFRSRGDLLLRKTLRFFRKVRDRIGVK